MKTRTFAPIALAITGVLASANAAIITVNTVNNTDFGPGVTNLWLAIQTANTNGESSNTIRFNIPGAGPHYIVTPQFYAPTGVPALGGGYPTITNHNLTIDGYSQPGALANTNTILGSNTAVLKIVIDSRTANYTTDANHPVAVGAETLNYALITGKTYGTTENGWAGFGAGEAAQIALFKATNVTIKGLCFLNDLRPDTGGLIVYSVALGADYPTNYPDLYQHVYPDYNLHVSGCWFNLQPDGTAVVDGGASAVCSARHRMGSNNGYIWGRWSPSAVTVGVAKNSANPRAEFNIIMSQSVAISCQGERGRFSGNFFNVRADGMHQYFPDPQRYPGSGFTDPNYLATQCFIGQNYAGYTVIGTDGDGVNDAEERNIFAGLPRKRARGVAQINHQSGNYHIKIAGNYFGVAVDGVTRWTNSSTAIRYSNRPDVPTNCVFGTEFDGVSDAIEGNVICNNWPLDYWFEHPDTEPYITDFFGYVPFESYGAVPETVDSDKLGSIAGSYFCTSFRGNKLINNFTAPESPVYTWRDAANAPGYFPTYTNTVVAYPFSYDVGFSSEGATNFIAVLDPSSTTRRLKGTFQLGIAPCTNVVIDVYVANEEGLTNGPKFLTLTNVLPVWAQGESVLAYNLQADTPEDLDPATGAFNFNVSQYNIPPGSKVTVTASYAKAGVVGTYMAEMHTSRFSLPISINSAPPITITSIVNNGDGTGTINWTGGDAPYIVEECTDLGSNTWVPIATNATPSITGPLGQAAAFYRVQ